MMLIPCPWCGPRNQDEFLCGGEAHITRPPEPDMASDAQWSAYQFDRINPIGLHYERWLHVYGCMLWFHAARDTVTHEIRAVYDITDTPREPQS